MKSHRPKPSHFRGLVAGLAAVIVAGSTLGHMSVPPAQAAVTSKSLAVVKLKQEQTNWCWAASARMIGVYKGTTSLSQCDIVKKTLPLPPGCPNLGATDNEVRSALTKAGLPNWTNYTGMLAMTTIINQINANKPVEYDYKYTNSTSKHVVVITGYWNDSSVSDSGYLYYNDPWTGINVGKSWLNLKSNNDWTASFTVYNIS